LYSIDAINGQLTQKKDIGIDAIITDVVIDSHLQ
jgi:hypothetical protein